MRRQHFAWTYLVTAIVLTIYGAFNLIYNHVKGKEMSILGLVFLIVGASLLVVYFVLLLISLSQKKKIVTEEKPVEKEPEPVIETKKEITPTKVEKPATPVRSSPKKEVIYTSRSSSSRFNDDTIYVRKVGYGPVLRVTGPEILDMRTNTYYRIEGHLVKQVGSGPIFEISGSRIRHAFGGYLYEISGDNVNKTYGGFYASFTGNYLQTYDLKEKYEIDGRLVLAQKLAIVALLFGAY